eukprot:gene15048-20248_t
MENPNSIKNIEQAKSIVTQMHFDICHITNELFAAYENEYSIFCPMSNCFELFGLDFIIDENYQTYLLEVNPGPDFKQTGDRLHYIISELWEQTIRITVDSAHNTIETKSEKLDNENYYKIIEMCDVNQQEYNKWKNISKDLTLVYSKEWSVARLQGGMSFEK